MWRRRGVRLAASARSSTARTRRLALGAVLLASTVDSGCSSCTGGSQDRVDQDRPAQGPELALVVPEAAVERVEVRRPGVVGPIVMPREIAAIDPSLRGALVDRAGHPRFRRNTAFAAVAVGDGSWVLAGALSGLWLLEAGTLALRARLTDDVVGDVASSPDGARFAFARCGGTSACTLEVRAFPSLELIASAPVPVPSRVRFSPDGHRIVVASVEARSVTIVELASVKVTSLDAGEIVNDAVFLGDLPIVAYATNDDDFVVRNYEKDQVLSRTVPTTAFGTGGGHRDQRALAFDASRDVLHVGGNDDTVWRIGGMAKGAHSFLGSTQHANDVVDLAFGPGGAAFVALDCGSVVDLSDPARPTTVLGDSVALSSWGARIDVRANGIVTGVLGSTVFSWSKGAPPTRAEAFSPPALGWIGEEHGDTDVVLVGSPTFGAYLMTFPRPVVRASLRGPDRLDVRPTPIGHAVFASGKVEIHTLTDGTRILTGGWRDKAARIYRVPLGGALSEPVDLPVAGDDCSAPAVLPGGGQRIAYTCDGGAVVEIDAAGQRVIGTLAPATSLAWDAVKGSWTGLRE